MLLKNLDDHLDGPLDCPSSIARPYRAPTLAALHRSILASLELFRLVQPCYRIRTQQRAKRRNCQEIVSCLLVRAGFAQMITLDSIGRIFNSITTNRTP